MEREEIMAEMQAFREKVGIIASILMLRNGRVVAYDLPDDIRPKNISVMAATIFDAGISLHNEAKLPNPEEVISAAGGYRFIIRKCGKKRLFLVIVEINPPKPAVFAEMKRLAELFTDD